MPKENPEKPKYSNSTDLVERIRNAATTKFAKNLTDAELADRFEVSIHTIADWKRRPEWKAAVLTASGNQLGETFNEIRAAAPAAREVLFDQLRNGPPGVRLRIAQMICDWAVATHLK